jgi:RimJ/RimL family protein N-acetyltransferase
MMIVIRPVTSRDAAEFLALHQQLDEETKFMLLEPGERKTTVQQQEQRIESLLEGDTSMIFVAEAEGKLVGFLGAFGSEPRRVRHTIYIVIGIIQSYAGQGIGTRLFERLETWALEQGIHRLELTVMAPNEAAIALYHKAGFQIEGTKRDSVRLDDVYVDEYYMAKLI